MKSITKTKGDYLRVKEALEMLHENGVEWTEVYLRILIGEGKIKSIKLSKSRLVSTAEVHRIIGDFRAREAK